MGSPLGIPISAKPGMRSYKNYGRSVASSDQADEDDVCSERSLDIGVSEKSIKVAMNTATAGVTTAARATPADTQRDSISEVSTQLGQPGSSNEGTSPQVKCPASQTPVRSKTASKPAALGSQTSKQDPSTGSSSTSAPVAQSADISTRRTSERIAVRPPVPPEAPATAPPATPDRSSSAANTKKRARETKSATPAASVKVEKRRSELTRAEQAARTKGFVTPKPTDEHVAKAKDLYAQAEGYTVATYNQPLGQQIGDLLKHMTDQGFFAPDQGKRLSSLPGQDAAQFLPKASWCEGCLKKDRNGIQIPCMVEATATRCMACAIESVYTGDASRRLCSFRTTQWTSQAVHANTGTSIPAVPSGPLGAMENPIECPDSEDEEPGTKRPRVAPTEPTPMSIGTLAMPVGNLATLATLATPVGNLATLAIPTSSDSGPSETKPKVEPLSWEEARAAFNEELQPIVEFGERVAKPMDDHKEGILPVLAEYKLTARVQRGKERAYLLGAVRDLQRTIEIIQMQLLFKSFFAKLQTLIDKYFPDPS